MKNPANCGVEVGDTGLELPAKNPRKTRVHDSGGSKSGNTRGDSDPPTGPVPPPDPDLAAVVAAWPGLPPAIRAGIVAMVRAGQ